MYFSGKITNSFITFLNRKDFGLERLVEWSDLPIEFLQDPSCWLNAAQVEQFLQVLEKEYADKFPQEPFISLVGHNCNDLRAWGVLDSVLRMMQKPQDIFSQPQRFLSYFVSPAPPIGNLEKENESIAFDLPISNSEFPLVTEYLRAAFEALPLYVGKNMATARWKQTKVKIAWSDAQEALLPEEDLNVNVNPGLVQNLVHSLEAAQMELEQYKKKVFDQEKQIQALKLRTNISVEPVIGSVDSDRMRSLLSRLHDYLGRSTQIVTLLVKQDRMDRQVQEAMRRVDWEFVQVHYPHVIKEMLKLIEETEAPPTVPQKIERTLPLMQN